MATVQNIAAIDVNDRAHETGVLERYIALYSHFQWFPVHPRFADQCRRKKKIKGVLNPTRADRTFFIRSKPTLVSTSQKNDGIAQSLIYVPAPAPHEEGGELLQLSAVDPIFGVQYQVTPWTALGQCLALFSTSTDGKSSVADYMCTGYIHCQSSVIRVEEEVNLEKIIDEAIPLQLLVTEDAGAAATSIGSPSTETSLIGTTAGFQQNIAAVASVTSTILEVETPVRVSGNTAASPTPPTLIYAASLVPTLIRGASVAPTLIQAASLTSSNVGSPPPSRQRSKELAKAIGILIGGVLLFFLVSLMCYRWLQSSQIRWHINNSAIFAFNTGYQHGYQIQTIRAR
ncbi:hypothetical protein BDP27DRAFT_1368946 [Rhodocollybia butyracea]|uniref:Uncharacterized protein n=1 Tax=Rhodocollybia butyracea TaxID=206335 RepID=A0A9P5PB31_9AGAR|nr:hypothetical protein BDP27DRAFT_1368946 [Rhodocollybia butyracea]